MGEPFRLGRVLARSFDIWRRQLLVLLALALVVHAPRVATVEALGRLWQTPAGTDYERLLFRILPQMLATTLLDALFRGLSVAPVVFAVYARLQGREARVGESLVGGLRRFRPVLRVSLWLALMTVALCSTAGVLLFVFLDIERSWTVSLFRVVNYGYPLLVTLLLSPFWVAIPAAVVETEGTSLGRSWSLTRGHRPAICAILALLYGIDLGVRWTVIEVASYDLAGPLLWTVELLVVSLSAVLIAVGYHALRLEKEGVDVSKLVKVFA